MTKHYKWLSPDREPIHGGSGQYPPPGEWAEYTDVKPCLSGYHVCTAQQLPHWVPDCQASLWEVRTRFGGVEDGMKFVFPELSLRRKLEWSPKISFAWVTDCLEHALHVYKPERHDGAMVAENIEHRRQLLRGDMGYWQYLELMGDTHDAAMKAQYAVDGFFGTCNGSDFVTAAVAERRPARAVRSIAAGVEMGEDTRQETVQSWAIYCPNDSEERKWQGERLLEYAYGKIAP